jgi:SHS2 domain-containing protein
MGREVVARAATLRQAFVEALAALLALSVNPESVEAREVREVRAHGPSLEALLAHWIGECCYVLDVEGYLCRSIDLAVFDVERKTGAEPLRLHAFLHGEPIDPARHEAPGAIAPLVAENISITRLEGAYEIRLTIDGPA